MRQMKWFVGLAVMAAALVPPAAAGAATITVSTTSDTTANDGSCSLREAVAAASTNTASGGAAGECPAGDAGPTVDTIVLPSGPYALSSQITVGAGGPIVIQSDSASTRRTISMANLAGENRVFDLSTNTDLTLDTLAVTSADEVSSDDGGIIRDDSNAGVSLTLENSELSETNAGVTAQAGGLIYFESGGAGAGLTIDDSELTGGDASNSGGAIYDDDAPVTIERSSIHGNTSDGSFNGFAFGGGIGLGDNGGTLTMDDSDVYDNHVSTSNGGADVFGGGINAGSGGTIKRSLIYGNTANAGAHGIGGGINFSAPHPTTTLDVSNTTIFDNEAGPSSTGEGGGIAASFGMATLNNDTIAANTAADFGDQIYSDGTGTTSFTGSILSGGSDSCSGSPPNLVSGGFNATSATSCPSVASDKTTGSTGLAASLANNGGTTVGGTGGAEIQTLAIESSGTAFNLVPTADCTEADGVTPLTEDERGSGFTRPQDGACDAGAFELICTPVTCPTGGSNPGTTPAPATPGPTGRQAAALKKCKKKKGKARKKCKQKARKLPLRRRS